MASDFKNLVFKVVHDNLDLTVRVIRWCGILYFTAAYNFELLHGTGRENQNKVESYRDSSVV